MRGEGKWTADDGSALKRWLKKMGKDLRHVLCWLRTLLVLLLLSDPLIFFERISDHRALVW